MAKVKEFMSMTKAYDEFFDFANVYICEAHPSDGTWNFEENIKIENHKSIEERIAAAGQLQEIIGTDPKVPLYVDTMADTASKTFASVPERLVVVLDGKMIWQGGKGPVDYSLKAAEDWMIEFIKRR